MGACVWREGRCVEGEMAACGGMYTERESQFGAWWVCMCVLCGETRLCVCVWRLGFVCVVGEMGLCVCEGRDRGVCGGKDMVWVFVCGENGVCVCLHLWRDWAVCMHVWRDGCAWGGVWRDWGVFGGRRVFM